ncbi:MAG: hypothetical protein RRC34_01665 [Lentisphaeria bacterium]|nr:hypothetical protein [Lentisphaeria bacterium]
MIRGFKQRRPLSREERERRRLVRYLGAGQARFAKQKHHLDAESIRWRLYLITAFCILVIAGLVSLVRELT